MQDDSDDTNDLAGQGSAYVDNSMTEEESATLTELLRETHTWLDGMVAHDRDHEAATSEMRPSASRCPPTTEEMTDDPRIAGYEHHPEMFSQYAVPQFGNPEGRDGSEQALARDMRIRQWLAEALWEGVPPEAPEDM